MCTAHARQPLMRVSAICGAALGGDYCGGPTLFFLWQTSTPFSFSFWQACTPVSFSFWQANTTGNVDIINWRKECANYSHIAGVFFLGL